MCTLRDGSKLDVDAVLKTFLDAGNPFTGFDVYTHLPLAATLVGRSVCAHDVSSYVRERFNKGQMPGWASTQVKLVHGLGQGTVLYFKVTKSSKAGQAIKRILARMESER